jgi:hypothetical protein
LFFKQLQVGLREWEFDRDQEEGIRHFVGEHLGGIAL